MYYKKFSFWIICIASLAVVTVGIFFFADKKSNNETDTTNDFSVAQSVDTNEESSVGESESTSDSYEESTEESSEDSFVESFDDSSEESSEESFDDSSEESSEDNSVNSYEESIEDNFEESKNDTPQGGGTTMVLPYQKSHETPEGLGQSTIEQDERNYWFGKIHPAYVIVWDKEHSTSDDKPVQKKGMKIWLCDAYGNKIDYVYTNGNGVAKFEINVKGQYTVCFDGDEKFAKYAPSYAFEIVGEYFVSPYTHEIRYVSNRKKMFLYDKNKFLPFTIKTYDAVTQQPLGNVKVYLSELIATTPESGVITIPPLAEYSEHTISETGSRFMLYFEKEGYDKCKVGYLNDTATEVEAYLNPTTEHPYTIKIINQKTRVPVSGVELIINTLGDNSVVYTPISGEDGIVSGMKTSQDLNATTRVQLNYKLDVKNFYDVVVDCSTVLYLDIEKGKTEYTVYLSINVVEGHIKLHTDDVYHRYG